MLLSFSVSNLYSIKDHITVDFRKKNKSDLAVNVASFFGANASGKTKILVALATFFEIVRAVEVEEKFKLSDYHIYKDIVPYAFQKEKTDTTFEVVFSLNGDIYRYSLSINRKRINEEVLEKKQVSKRFSRVFKRTWKESINGYQLILSKEIGEENKRQLNSLNKRSVVRTLLQAAANEENKLLSPLHSFFSQVLVVTPTMDFSEYTENLLFEDEDLKSDLVKLFKEFDFAFNNIIIERKENSEDELELYFEYIVDGISYKLPSLLESAGTRRFFAIALVILLMKQSYGVLVVDEIENALHPEIVRKIVKLFKKFEMKGQLIFTSHYDSLMDDLERDEIWIVEKNYNLFTTEITRLSEYQGVRKDLSKRKAYRQGVFGGIPILGDKDE